MGQNGASARVEKRSPQFEKFRDVHSPSQGPMSSARQMGLRRALPLEFLPAAKQHMRHWQPHAAPGAPVSSPLIARSSTTMTAQNSSGVATRQACVGWRRAGGMVV